MKAYSGKSIYPGIVFGTIFLINNIKQQIDESPAENTLLEWERFEKSKLIAYAEFDRLFQKTLKEIGKEEANIIDVQRMILGDDDFCKRIRIHIMDEKLRADHAVLKAGNYFSGIFSALDDPYMQARAPDIIDAARRLIRILTGGQDDINIDTPSILVADDLTPSEIMQLDKSKIRAFIMRKGSTNSHAAILIKSLRIPMLIQTDIPSDKKFNGSYAVVDSHSGKIYLNPDEETIQKLEILRDNDRKSGAELEKQRGLPSITQDGIKIDLFANIAGPEDLEAVLANDAEGIGVFRSEFLYLSRNDFPGEEEQFEAYYKVAACMKDRVVIIRTLDLGADKNVPYFGIVQEENPALGFRAIRICFERLDVFKTQLRAIYRASAFGNIHIMFPMIASLWELKRCKEVAAMVREELLGEGIPIGKVPLGIMIETPAAALTADELAGEADFFCVGTNDLTQYTLAADRQNEKLTPYLDPYHPAILKLLEMTARSARRAGIFAGICGELAADPVFTEKFIRMGFTELSVSPGFILKTRQRIREINIKSSAEVIGEFLEESF